MSGVDSSNALVGVYRIDVHCKKQYWPHYIDTTDVLKSASYKASLLENPEAEMEFLQFTRRAATQYLNAAKVVCKLPSKIIYPRKNFWKGNKEYQKMKELVRNMSFKRQAKRDVVSSLNDQVRGV